MSLRFGTTCLLSFALALTFAWSAPTSAEVIVNNIFSPFTTIQVVPPYRAYRGYYGYGDTWWIHNPNHHQRCYRRWHPYYGEWHTHCVRMHYWGEAY